MSGNVVTLLDPAQLPARFESVEALEEFLSRPSQALIDDLQSKLTQLETGEQALRAELQTREAATHSINEQLTASLEIIVGLKSAAEAQQEAQEETATSLTAAQSEVQTLQKELLTTQGDLAAAQNELQSAREETATAKSDLQTANDNIAAVQRDLDAANEKLQTVQNELQDKVQALTESTNRNRELEAAVENLSKAPPVVSEPASPVATAITPPPPQAGKFALLILSVVFLYILINAILFFD